MAGIFRKRSAYALLMETSTTTMKKLGRLLKIFQEIQYGSAIPLMDVFSKEIKSLWRTDTGKPTVIGTRHNIQDMESSQMCVIR